jgi:hypothetical protein
MTIGRNFKVLEASFEECTSTKYPTFAPPLPHLFIPSNV